MVVTLTPEETKAMDALKGKIYGRTVFDKDFEKALNGKPFVMKYPPKGNHKNNIFNNMVLLLLLIGIIKLLIIGLLEISQFQKFNL